MIYKELKIEPNTYIKDPEFSKKIKSAIDLLDSKANAEFLNLKKYTKIIRAARASGANYNEKEMTIDIARTTFDASLEWLASVFIHENHHLQKYKDTGKKYGNASQEKDKKKALQIMIAEEVECNKIQLIALKKIGGTAAEVDYLAGQKGDHFDINRDGLYDEKDYGSRTW